ncbi:MAG: hypothetical protein LBG27_01180 [Spirochaetaceae bacterium]|nr:hypothetical protein [Spirochaetaceae bacterium]
MHGGNRDRNRNYRYVEPHQFEIYSDLEKRIDTTKQYKIYIGFYAEVVHNNVFYSEYGGEWTPFIDKIEELRTLEEVAALEAQQKAEAEAKKKAEAEAKAAAQEAKSNPNKLDRSQYTKITVEDFSFDMVAGKLPVGSKVSFKVEFLTKPTGTEYMFKGVNTIITMSSSHNFVRDMPAICFGSVQSLFGRLPQQAVTVYATVKRPG